MSTQPMAIRARGLWKAFAGQAVLRGVDLDVPAGQSIALTGANGAGKSTLLRCLASILRPTEGRIEWFGEPAGQRPTSRRLVGLVAHESFLYPQLTSRENLLFAARMYGLPEPGQRADEMLDQTGLRRQADSLSSTLSRGTRQRLAVARALIHDPPILLLDEPFAGMDRQAAEWLVQILLQLRQSERTLCLVLHEEAKIRRLADRVVELQAGRLTDAAGPARIVTGDLLRAA